VPSDAVRGGNFRRLATICDPQTVPATGSCTPFPNNQIPAGRIDPIAAAFLQQCRAPRRRRKLQNLTSVEESTRDIDQFSVRVDHRLTRADQPVRAVQHASTPTSCSRSAPARFRRRSCRVRPDAARRHANLT
jgi:hypothetical protein